MNLKTRLPNPSTETQIFRESILLPIFYLSKREPERVYCLPDVTTNQHPRSADRIDLSQACKLWGETVKWAFGTPLERCPGHDRPKGGAPSEIKWCDHIHLAFDEFKEEIRRKAVVVVHEPEPVTLALFDCHIPCPCDPASGVTYLSVRFWQHDEIIEIFPELRITTRFA